MSDAGIVDHDVGDTVFGAHPLGESLDGIGIRDVKGVGVCDAAARSYLGGGVLDAGLVDIADHQLGALTGEGQRRLATNAAAGSGHRNQCVTEVFARTADLSAQQLTRRRLAAKGVDELLDGLREHLRVRHRRPVTSLDIAPPQPRDPLLEVVVDVRSHERVLGVDDDLDGNVDVVVGPGRDKAAKVVGAVNLQLLAASVW